MTLISVTRFRLHSVRFMPFFMLHANRTIAQIRKADGFLTGAVQRDADQAFWTMTLWRDELAMRSFGTSSAHRTAMPHLVEWADEVIGAHRMAPGRELPVWAEAVRPLRAEGSASFLRHPQADRVGGGFAEPR